MKRTIHLELLCFEVKFKIHEGLNEYEREIHIKLYVFIYEYKKASFGLSISCLFEEQG